MRQRLKSEIALLRNPGELFTKLASHFDVHRLPPNLRRRLLRRAAPFVDMIVEPEGLGIKRGLAELLNVSLQEAREIAFTYSAQDKTGRMALQARLTHLGTLAPVSQARSFLQLVPKVREPIASAFEPLLTQHPDLRPWIQSARSHLVRYPNSVLRHIDGETHSGSELTGGGHLLETFEKLADVALSKWPPAELKRFKSAIANLNPAEARQQIIAMYGHVGFDLSGQRWAKFLLVDQIRWRIAERRNGVRCFRVPRRYFNGRAWDNTRAAAKYGTSPIGGKTLFPAKWSQSDILQAIIEVLDHPDPFVLRRVTRAREPRFYLRARIRDVDVEVGISGRRVKTAFPSWRQDRPDTIGEAYVEWFDERIRLKEQWQHNIVREEPAVGRLQFPSGLVACYLGQCPPGLSAPDWQKVRMWLQPDYLANAPSQWDSAVIQMLVFDWLERSRVVREMEGASGPVH